MTTYASFKPSVQFLEAGEKAQQFANAANTFKPLLFQEARQSIEASTKLHKHSLPQVEPLSTSASMKLNLMSPPLKLN